jgi:hypothetical protein
MLDSREYHAARPVTERSPSAAVESRRVANRSPRTDAQLSTHDQLTVHDRERAQLMIRNPTPGSESGSIEAIPPAILADIAGIGNLGDGDREHCSKEKIENDCTGGPAASTRPEKQPAASASTSSKLTSNTSAAAIHAAARLRDTHWRARRATRMARELATLVSTARP